jgi:hypothetical protein
VNTVTLSAGVALILAWIVWEWLHPAPIVDIKLFKKRNFATVMFFTFVLGIVLFGATVVIPQFLQNLLGYPAIKAGDADHDAGCRRSGEPDGSPDHDGLRLRQHSVGSELYGDASEPGHRLRLGRHAADVSVYWAAFHLPALQHAWPTSACRERRTTRFPG